jgi:hypothetical protein
MAVFGTGMTAVKRGRFPKVGLNIGVPRFGVILSEMPKLEPSFRNLGGNRSLSGNAKPETEIYCVGDSEIFCDQRAVATAFASGSG